MCKTKMTLRNDAEALLASLISIVAGAEAYSEKHKNNYIGGLTKAIKPLVDEYTIAIKERKSKEEAKEALSQMSEFIHELNGASTKGEMDIFPESNKSLNEYWRLHTIFKELKYKEHQL